MNGSAGQHISWCTGLIEQHQSLTPPLLLDVRERSKKISPHKRQMEMDSVRDTDFFTYTLCPNDPDWEPGCIPASCRFYVLRSLVCTGFTRRVETSTVVKRKESCNSQNQESACLLTLKKFTQTKKQWCIRPFKQLHITEKAIKGEMLLRTFK